MSSDPIRPAMSFDLFAVRLLYVVAFGVAAISPAQTDVWWLLRAGHDIVHTHHVSLVDHYSFTAYGDHWPNHEWLWEVAAYVLHSLGGMPLLSAAVAASVVATLAVLRHTTSARGYVVPITLVVALPLLAPTWTVRPQVTSILLYAVLMLLLARGHEAWIPVVMLVWANTHGQVVTGGALLVIVTVAAVGAARRDPSPQTRQRARRMVVVTVVSGALTLATPLGFGLWTYLMTFGSQPGPGHQQIAEWTNAFHPTPLALLFWVVLAAAATLAVVRRERLHGWAAQVLVCSAIAAVPFALIAVRNVPLFVAAVLPLFMTLLEFRTTTPVGTVRRASTAIIAATVVVIAGVSAVWVADPPRLEWHPVEPGLATALRSCPGRLYNDYNAGAPLVWWVPEVKVFVDNRRDPFPRDVVDAASDLDRSTYRPVFARWQIRCALVDRAELLAPALIDGGWHPAYETPSIAVLVPPATD